MAEVKTGRKCSSTSSEQPWEWVASEHCLRDGTAESDHGEATVLQLREAQLALALFVLWQELHTETIVPRALKGVPFEDLLSTAEFHQGDPEEDLEIHADSTVELVVGIDGYRDGL